MSHGMPKSRNVHGNGRISQICRSKTGLMCVVLAGAAFALAARPAQAGGGRCTSGPSYGWSISFGSGHGGYSHGHGHRVHAPRYDWRDADYCAGERAGYDAGYDRGYWDGYYGRVSCCESHRKPCGRSNWYDNGYRSGIRSGYDCGYQKGCEARRCAPRYPSHCR
jgi:hypothetical protein